MSGNEVVIWLRFEYYGGGLLQDDAFKIYLPSFWSVSSSVRLVNNSGAGFIPTWIPCSGTLILAAASSTNHSSAPELNFYVAGLRLPFDGVNPTLAGQFNISSNASLGTVPAQTFDVVQLLCAVSNTTVTFSNSKLNSTTDIYLQFQVSCPMLIGDVVQVILPNMTCHREELTVFPVASPFAARWDSTSSALSIVASTFLEANNLFSITINSTHNVFLPDQGYSGLPKFPGKPILIGYSGLQGTAPFISPDTIGYVGFVLADVFYDIQDVSSYIAVRLHFQLSHTVLPNDVIYVHTPYVLAAANVNSVLVTGSNVVSSFRSPFNLTFDSTARVFRLVAKESLLSQETYVFVAVSNMLKFDIAARSKVNHSSHTVWAHLANIGNLSAVAIEVLPQSLPTIQSIEKALVSNCSVNLPCSFQFNFHVYQPLLPGELVLFSHPNIQLATGYSALNLSLSGGAVSEYFQGLFRDADSADTLQITSTSILLDGGVTNAVYGSADYNVLNGSLVLPSTSTNAVIVAVIPRIQFLSVSDVSPNVICGDSMLIQVVFSEPVMIVKQTIVKLLMNTKEYAYYVSGNNSDILTFIYHVIAPVTVNDLEVDGPYALDFGTDGLICRSGSVGVPANTTIPEPYGYLLRGGGTLKQLSIDCTRTAHVKEVKALSRAGTYSSGDIIDVGVVFDLDVVAVGTPRLILQGFNGGTGKGNTAFVARFYNVSKEQYVTAYSGGYFALTYGSSTTSCVLWSDGVSLLSQVRGLVDLKLALPVTMTTYPLANGFKYVFLFHGVAPTLLSVGT